jgi:hypothetical protein
LQSGQGRAALQRRLQSIVDAYREADVAAAAERRRREQRVAMTEDSDDADEDEDEDEASRQQGDASSAP